MKLSNLIYMVALLAAPSPLLIAQGAIQVTVRAAPGNVGAGQAAMISVLARNEVLAPVSDAAVSITCDRGVFGVAAFTARGRTDHQGRFNAVWRAGPQGRGRLVINARKRGMRPGIATLTLPVRAGRPAPRAQPPPAVRPGRGIPPELNDRPLPRDIKRAPLPIIVSAEPASSRVPAGGSTAITVNAATPAGEPVAGATVKLAVGGGSFSGSGTATVTGLTDRRGQFVTTWHTAPEAAYRGGALPYGIAVDVGKPGHVPAHVEVGVTVVPKPRTGVVTGVIPLALKMGIKFTARPDRIKAGGATALYVSVTDSAGRRLPGARVFIHTGSGEFRNTKGLTATGTTDANGNFMIQWRTAHPRAIPRDVDQVFDIKVEKQGHVTTTSRAKIRIQARRIQ